MQTPYRIEMLGGFRLMHGDYSTNHLRTRKTEALLAFLACSAGRKRTRVELAELFWPGGDGDMARSSLRSALSFLRKALKDAGISPDVLYADSVHVSLNPKLFETDVAEFEAKLSAAAKAKDISEKISLQTQTVSLYRGELLPGYEEYWIVSERRRLQESIICTLHDLVGLLESTSDLKRALDYAHRCLAADPLREESHLIIIRLYATAGQLTEALRQYNELERILRVELNTTPSPDSMALAESLRQEKKSRLHRGHVHPMPVDVPYSVSLPSRESSLASNRKLINGNSGVRLSLIGGCVLAGMSLSYNFIVTHTVPSRSPMKTAFPTHDVESPSINAPVPSPSELSSLRIIYYETIHGAFHLSTIRGDRTRDYLPGRKEVSGLTPTVSPNGKYIAFERTVGNVPQIHVMNSDGTGIKRLTQTNAAEMNPVWSPDNIHIAFFSRRNGIDQIFTIRIDGKEEQPLTTTATRNGHPWYSPDGKHIAFRSSRLGPQRSDIFIMDADGGNAHSLTGGVSGKFECNTDPSWSPDGKKIAFTSTRNGNQLVYVMDVDGTHVTLLTQQGQVETPRWSPDGCFIVFSSDKSGKPQLYAIRSTGSQPLPITSSDNPCNGPFCY